MAKVKIGDKEYLVGELNFIAMEKAWDAIQATMIQPDPIRAVGAALEVIAAAIQEQDYFKREDFGIKDDETLDPPEIDQRVTLYLKRQLKASQIMGVTEGLETIITEAGLRPEPGEEMVPGTESLGTGTADQSSRSSSPPGAKVGAGTA